MKRKFPFHTRLYDVHILSLLSLPTSHRSLLQILSLSLSLISHLNNLSLSLSSFSPKRRVMAQKAEKNDTEFKVPEPITPCATATTAAATSISEPSRFFDAATPAATTSRSPKRSLPLEDAANADRTAASEPKRAVNRCSGCRRRVGLTGFRCRCGDLFCAEHRYSDRHDCSYDYKAAGREAIARENPVVKAAKIVKV